MKKNQKKILNDFDRYKQALKDDIERSMRNTLISDKLYKFETSPFFAYCKYLSEHNPDFFKEYENDHYYVNDYFTWPQILVEGTQDFINQQLVKAGWPILVNENFDPEIDLFLLSFDE